MPRYEFFCYVCKSHIPFIAKDEKDAKQMFTSHGHNSDKVKQLRKGLVGR